MNPFILIVQVCCVLLHLHLMLKEIEYCGHHDWCWRPGLYFFVVCTLIPYFGIFVALGGCVDYTKNIIEELKGE